MNTKQSYMAPEVVIVHLQMEGGAILSGSVISTGTGANVTFEEESNFDTFFN